MQGSGPRVVPGSPPPIPALHHPPAPGFLGKERRLRRGLGGATSFPPRSAPTHIAPRPRQRRAPLPGPAATAAAHQEIIPPCPAPPPRGRRSPAAPTRRCGRADRSGRPPRSLEGPFGGLCSREQGACANTRGRSQPPLSEPGGGGAEPWRGRGRGNQTWDGRFLLPGSVKGRGPAETHIMREESEGTNGRRADK